MTVGIRDRTTASPTLPRTYRWREKSNAGVESYCIDRHRMAVNIVFFDVHAEHLQLATLWKLKWSRNSKPTEVVVR